MNDSTNWRMSNSASYLAPTIVPKDINTPYCCFQSFDFRIFGINPLNKGNIGFNPTILIK